MRRVVEVRMFIWPVVITSYLVENLPFIQVLTGPTTAGVIRKLLIENSEKILIGDLAQFSPWRSTTRFILTSSETKEVRYVETLVNGEFLEATYTRGKQLSVQISAQAVDFLVVEEKFTTSNVKALNLDIFRSPYEDKNASILEKLISHYTLSVTDIFHGYPLHRLSCIHWPYTMRQMLDSSRHSKWYIREFLKFLDSYPTFYRRVIVNQLLHLFTTKSMDNFKCREYAEKFYDFLLKLLF